MLFSSALYVFYEERWQSTRTEEERTSKTGDQQAIHQAVLGLS